MSEDLVKWTDGEGSQLSNPGGQWFRSPAKSPTQKEPVEAESEDQRGRNPTDVRTDTSDSTLRPQAPRRTRQIRREE